MHHRSGWWCKSFNAFIELLLYTKMIFQLSDLDVGVYKESDNAVKIVLLMCRTIKIISLILTVLVLRIQRHIVVAYGKNIAAFTSLDKLPLTFY